MKLLVFLFTSGMSFGYLLLPYIAKAQIVPDGTTQTEIGTCVSQCIIQGGIKRDSNLFHSFTNFNVGENQQVIFINPLGIDNILNRVVGINPSYIKGKLGVEGKANLFLLNPKGILFGPSAQLELQGSFVASTATSLVFSDGSDFSAVNPQVPSPLAINVPIGLQFGPRPENISNEVPIEQGRVISTRLQVGSGSTLALLGGPLTFTKATLRAEEGRIELASISSPSLVGLKTFDKSFIFEYDGVQSFNNIKLVNGTSVATNTRSSNSADGIQLQGDTINLEKSIISSTTLGKGAGGNLTINAVNSINLSEARIATFSLDNRLIEDEGSAGNIQLQTRGLALTNGAEISSNTSGAGVGGTITIIGPKLLSLSGNAQIATFTSGSGDAGNIIVDRVDYIDLNTPPLKSSTITITGIVSQVCPGLTNCGSATGSGGNLILDARRLSIQGGSRIDASTFGLGRAGDIKIEVPNIQLTGSLLDLNAQPVKIGGAPVTSGIFTQVGVGAIANAGNAGDITINTERLTATKGGQISSATFSGGNGGRVTINASDSIRLNGEALGATEDVGKSGIFASAEPGATGDAGALDITTQELTVDEQAEISVRNFGGRAGNLVINADSVVLNQGRLTAKTAGEGGANIVLRGLDLLQMQNQSLISAEALKNASGGNIIIDAPNGSIIAATDAEVGNGNDIVAKAFEGRGGVIFIRATDIMGLQERKSVENNATNDIDASSEFGEPGAVITEFAVPSELPSPTLVTSDLAQGCQVTGRQASAEFFNTGRGGLPPTPYEALSSSDVLDDVRIPGQASALREKNAPSDSKPKPPESIVEAQGWVMSQEGTVLLVAEAPSTELQSRCNLH